MRDVEPEIRFAAAILAGGASRRMGGIPKALLEIGGRSIILRVIDVLQTIFSRVILITNTPEVYEHLRLPMFADIHPGSAALGGLHTALVRGEADRVFVSACDMPFLNGDSIRAMMCFAPDYDVVVPRTGDYLEPLHAFYSPACVPHIEKLIEERNFTILDFYMHVRVKKVSKDEAPFNAEDPAFMNVNTPAELDAARCLLPCGNRPKSG
jgi:molybdopterin-guanine dinucleotide biosynthesis protein A